MFVGYHTAVTVSKQAVTKVGVRLRDAVKARTVLAQQVHGLVLCLVSVVILVKMEATGRDSRIVATSSGGTVCEAHEMGFRVPPALPMEE